MANTGYDEAVAMEDDIASERGGPSMRDGLDARARFDAASPISKTRSLSDGGGTQLSPSPNITGASRRTSKDDSSLGEPPAGAGPPVTPRRPDFPIRGLSIQLPRRDPSPVPAAAASVRPSPLSPQIDRSHIYASPTNILPRRSRGLDFSRAATSLHHSTLAEQSSPDSSPTIGGAMGRAMDIPGRSIGDFGTEQTTKSLWSMMGDRERNHISSSVGSANPLASSSSSSSDDDDFMDDFVDDTFVGTPTAAKTGPMMVDQTTPQGLSASPGVPWLASNSPAMNSLSSFRTRPRKPPKKKFRGLLNLGFRSANPGGATRSPPHNLAKDGKDASASQSRRESISWAANQLHISSADAEDRAMESIESPQRGVIKRTVTRRGNLLPKTKGFARIRAALAEEGAPVDCETRREAEVIRQVRESDTDLEPRVPSAPPAPLDIAGAPLLSPNLPGDNIDDVPEDDMLGEPGLSGSFKQQALKNSKGKVFWDTFSETSSVAGSRVTPPPPSFLPRGSSSGISEDVNMDSPSLSTGSGPTNNNVFGPGPMLGAGGSDGNRSDTPQAPASAPDTSLRGRLPPSAEEITRRINNKRRRDDDFDPVSFKRRAVSPGMSVHNSPSTQSPLQRDNMPWGSRPGSNGAEKASGSPSDHSSSGANTSNNNNNNGGGGSRPPNGSKGRVGFQGMVDTNDGLMRMSIE